jgi:hypothetical protein
VFCLAHFSAQLTGRAKEEALSGLKNLKEHKKASSRDRLAMQFAEKCVLASRYVQPMFRVGGTLALDLGSFLCYDPRQRTYK